MTKSNGASVWRCRFVFKRKITVEKRNLLSVGIDSGGGMANLGVFRQGKEVCTACLNVGDRLIKVSDGKITFILPFELRKNELCDII